MKKNSIEQDAQYTAALDADSTRERLAQIYAQALLDACVNTGASLDGVWDEYDSFLEICDAYPKFEEILASIMVPFDEKRRILDEIGNGVSEIFMNFLKTLARRGRFDLLRLVRVECRKLDNERMGRVPVVVTTAAPMDEATKASLVANLRKLVGGEPEFVLNVDPSTIGGIIVRVGDVIYDASITTQLNKARQDMINRSAHEIQSRRDSFRHPEGN